MTARDDTQRPGHVVALMGSTATGKSAIALEAAERTGAEIVNCDALQVYQGLDVGTAKPSLSDRERVPHHLYDVRKPTQVFSAGEYASAARDTLDRLTTSRHVVLVGGTGLYFRALTQGIAAIPPIPADVQREVRGRAHEDGLAATHARLLELDPATGAKIHAADRQRILRALEVLAATGKGQSAWIAEQPKPNNQWQLERLLLTSERSLLYHRIELRTQAMFSSAWIEEVESLLERGVPEDAPAFQAIGYRQIIGLLHGRISEAEALEQIIVATRRYAKRQATWFRKEPGFTALEAAQPALVVDRIVDYFSFHSFQGGGSQ